MSPWFPSGPVLDRLLVLQARAAALLRRAAARTATTARAAAAAARRLTREARDRQWPALREGVRVAVRRAERGAHRAAARLRPGLGRIRDGLRRGWDRLGPWTAGVAAVVRRVVILGARVLRRLAPSPRVALVLAVVALVVGGVLWERCGLEGCPDVGRLASYQPGGASVLLDRSGEAFGTLAPMEYEVVALDSLPPHVAQAFIAVEDRRFHEHRGVDWIRALGAAWADIRARGLVQGSSTIPMQLSRTLFPDRIRREEKTFRRKLLEARVATEIEERYTKREILELYLNHVYLGGGSYGVQSASRYYFGKEAAALTVEEAALLAALPRAPSHYDPRRHPEAARQRRDLVLSLMEEQGMLPFREANAARERPLAVAEEPGDTDGDRPAPWFVAQVRRRLGDELGERLYAEPLRIHTTLDLAAQQAAEAELEAQLRVVERGAFGRLRGPRYRDSAERMRGTDYLQGAVVFMDARTGDIRAWVGGRDFDHSRYDRALLARRQAGSAFKPFVYAAALEAGLVPSQPILDTPYYLARQGAPDWRPENYSGGFEGVMLMRDALVRSQNIPAIRLAASIGDEPVRDFARRAGLGGEVPASPVAALGVTTVSPLEMTVAFSSFARLGTRVEPRFVLRVEDERGEVVWSSAPAAVTRVTSPEVAYVLTDMLRDVVDRGTGRGARGAGFLGVAAGKTGTTSDATDVWFVGYTPELVGTVWVGFDEVRPVAYRATGGGIAAPVWGRIMARAVGKAAGGPDGWARPPGVVTRWVDPETGMPLRDGCEPYWEAARREVFPTRAELVTTCPRRAYDSFGGRFRGWFDAFTGYRREAYIPGEPDPELGVPRLPRVDDPTERGRRHELDHDYRGRPLGRPVGLD